MNSFVKLAKLAIEEYLKSGQVFDIKKADANLLKKKAGCFISIHTKKNELRGCIGTIMPACKNLASEIINNAIAVCNDPRFEPITKDEMNN